MSLPAKICLLLLMLFAASIYAESSRASLEALFAETYDPNRKVDSDWVLSRERNLAAWKRKRAVREAIKNDEDLSFLSKYGLEKEEATWYEVDLRGHLDWMTSYNLLGPFSSWRRLAKNQTELYQLGMSVAEVEKLGRYVLANDIYEMRIQARLDYLHKEESTYIARLLQGGEDYAAIYKNYIDDIGLLLHLVEVEWAAGLLNQFESDAQEILLTLSLSKVSSRIGMGKGSFNLDQEVDIFVGYFLSGELTTSWKESLQRHRDKRLAEIAQINTEFKPPADKAVNECRCPPEQCSYTNP